MPCANGRQASGNSESQRIGIESSSPGVAHILYLFHKCGSWANFTGNEQRMSRISIDVTDDEHKRLKAMAALRGKSIKDYVLERTLDGNRRGRSPGI